MRLYDLLKRKRRAQRIPQAPVGKRRGQVLRESMRILADLEARISRRIGATRLSELKESLKEAADELLGR